MYLIILNSLAGHGKALEYERAICQELDARKLPHRTARTQHVGDATQLAQDAVREGCAAIVCVGGDGTLHEVANGLIEGYIPINIVPCGTGNDFAKSLPLVKDPIAAFRQQLDGQPRPVDFCRMNEEAFLNVAGTGFDVEVLRQSKQGKHGGGGLRHYLRALFAALRNFKPIDARVTIDGETSERSLTLITISNGKYFGGGMKVAPTAVPDDGYFDAVIIRAVKRWQVPFLLPLFIVGLHTKLRITTVVRCKSLILESAGMTIELDGELKPVDRAEFSLVTGRRMVSY